MTVSEIVALVGVACSLLAAARLLALWRKQGEKLDLEIAKLRRENQQLSIEVGHNHSQLAEIVRDKRKDILSSEGATSMERDKPPVTIESPENGAFVGHAVPMEGTVGGVPNDKEIWIVKQIAPYSFHPERGPVFVKNSRWWGTAYVGNNTPNADTGMRFTIHLVLATFEAGKKYNAYINNAYRTGRWCGMDSLFGGEILTTVQVVRDDANVIGV